MYFYAQGAWLALHPDPPGKTVWFFDQSYLPVANYDGGDGTATAGPYSGPMWQLAQDISGKFITARFPIAAGTLPSGTVLTPHTPASATADGEEAHTLSNAEMNHAHFTITEKQAAALVAPTATAAIARQLSGQADYDYVLVADTANVASLGLSSGVNGGDPTIANTAHNNLPRYIVGTLLQRSQRLYYAYVAA